MALSGGEDYELLFTASAAVIDMVKKVLSCPVTVIGEITSDKAAGVIAFDREGRPFQLAEKGWDHFARQNSA
jgi:thiamine-monophosphate kinase